MNFTSNSKKKRHQQKIESAKKKRRISTIKTKQQQTNSERFNFFIDLLNSNKNNERNEKLLVIKENNSNISIIPENKESNFNVNINDPINNNSLKEFNKSITYEDINNTILEDIDNILGDEGNDTQVQNENIDETEREIIIGEYKEDKEDKENKEIRNNHSKKFDDSIEENVDVTSKKYILKKQTMKLKENKIIEHNINLILNKDKSLTGKKKINKREIDIVKNEIKKNFEFSDIKPIDYIIGIKFIRCKDGYIMHQLNYLNKILDKFNIDKYKECSNLTFIEDEKLRNRKFDSQTYMKAVGSLLYLAMGTRPDIIFAVSKASRKNNNPTYEDWINVLKIFRYLKGTKNMGIKFNKSLFLSVYVDADLGGDNETKRSTTGFVVKLGSAPVTWYSKLQHCVAISTAESEYYSLNECALKCMWIKNFLNELGINIKCININIDNKAAIYNSKNETINPKSRHIDLRFHKIRELVKENKISLRYIKSQYNLADGFTKYLNGTLMKKFKNSLLTDFSKY